MDDTLTTKGEDDNSTSEDKELTQAALLASFDLKLDTAQENDGNKITMNKGN